MNKGYTLEIIFFSKWAFLSSTSPFFDTCKYYWYHQLINAMVWKLKAYVQQRTLSLGQSGNLKSGNIFITYTTGRGWLSRIHKDQNKWT